MKSPSINYKLVHDAIDWYQRCGYQYIEVPWVVSPEALNITRPVDLPPVDKPRLVASGEQSFLEMILKRKLEKGSFCCATPCYRPGDQGKGQYHFDQFFKVELITYGSDDIFMDKHEMIQSALSFFHEKVDAIITETKEEKRAGCVEITDRYPSIDIVTQSDRVELGSYGARVNESIGVWIYGTGLALPRFQQVTDAIS